MNSRLLSLWVLLSGCAACTSLPENSAVPFQQGNAHLARGHYAQAIGLYQQLARQGVERAELYCNRGNAFYRAGQVGWAVYYYEKGLALAPLDPQLLANRQAALAKAASQGAVVNAPPAPSQLAMLSVADGVALVAVLGVLGSSLLFLGGAFSRLHLRKERLLASSRYALLASGLLLGASGAAVVAYERHGAIIVQAKTVGRVGPSRAARQVFEARAGERVAIQNHYQGWVKVQTPSGEEGWLPTASVASLGQ